MKIEDLEKKAGSLIVGRLPATDLPSDFERLLKRGIIGGITVFKENVSDLEQLAILLSDVVMHSHHFPIMSVDQEGGAVQRFDQVLTPLPSALACAHGENAKEAVQKMFEINARQNYLLGINCLLAPVLDVASEKKCPIVCTRSFGADPKEVAELAIVAAKTISANNLHPVGKHFPGHGATKEDSHFDLACVDDELTLWQERDLAPFIECMPYLPIILTGHIWIKCIDEKPLPASLSPLVNGILRERMNYSGLVMTDDMTMKGITGLYGLGEACVMAIGAGADIVLVNGTIDDQLEAHSALVQAFASGRLPYQRLASALDRREKLFGKRPETAHPYKYPDRFSELEQLILKDREESFSISKQALSVLKADFSSSLEIQNCASQIEWQVLVPQHPRYPLNLVDELHASGCTSYSEIRYSLDPQTEEINELAGRCQGKNVVLLTFRAQNNKGQIDLAKAVAQKADIKLAVMCDTPFDLDVLPDWPCVVATYDPSDQSIKALAQFIKSKENANEPRAGIKSQSVK